MPLPKEKMKGMPGQYPYDQYLVYGPILHKGEGRRMVVLIPADPSSGIKRTSTSYPRYLMSVHLGRKLDRNEHVDHIDEDKLNDSIENLQVLSLAENNRKNMAARGLTKAVAVLRCPSCGLVFRKIRRMTHLVIKTNKSTSCSRECGQKTGSAIMDMNASDVEEFLRGNVIRIEHVPRGTEIE
jgi:hypothetical protein